jgi:quercetin dioxygenase-like cupin family protein
MHLELIPWDGTSPPDEDGLRQRLMDDGFDVFRWRDEAGVDYQPHAHDHDECLWVIDGDLIFGAAGRAFHLHPGDRLMLPKGTVHTAHAGAHGATYLIGERL